MLYIALFYGLYTLVRNLNGSVVSESTAFANAELIIDFERALGFFNEEGIQQFFLPHEWLIRLLNVWYGTAHFVVTIGVLLWLYHVQTDRYRHWRNVILATTGLALIGYFSFPLAPPRLLPADYGFVDTLEVIGGFLSFESESVKDLSNQYAAMPSMHVGWALWCAFAVTPVLQHRWSRAAIAVYPALTISTIVITANHYWADVAGGALTFGCGYLLASYIERQHQRRALIRSEADATVGRQPAPRERQLAGSSSDSHETSTTSKTSVWFPGSDPLPADPLVSRGE